MDNQQTVSVGVGIFFGAVFLGLIYLYVNTRDRWNWSRIAKRTLMVLVVLIAIPVAIGVGVVGYEKWGERPHLITSLEGISIGDKLSDVAFKHGVFEKREVTEGAVKKYADEESYVSKQGRTSFEVRGEIVRSVGYICNGKELDFTRVNGIQCGNTGDAIVKEAFGDKVRVLCERQPDANFLPTIVFDVVEYGTRFGVVQNKVGAFFISSKDELQSLTAYNWIPCK